MTPRDVAIHSMPDHRWPPRIHQRAIRLRPAEPGSQRLRATRGGEESPAPPGFLGAAEQDGCPPPQSPQTAGALDPFIPCLRITRRQQEFPVPVPDPWRELNRSAAALCGKWQICHRPLSMAIIRVVTTPSVPRHASSASADVDADGVAVDSARVRPQVHPDTGAPLPSPVR